MFIRNRSSAPCCLVYFKLDLQCKLFALLSLFVMPSPGWHWFALLPCVLALNDLATPASSNPSAVASSGAPPSIIPISVISSAVPSVSQIPPSSTPAASDTPASFTTAGSIPIPSTGFTPFPVPSDSPLPPVYPAVFPSNPPAVGLWSENRNLTD